MVVAVVADVGEGAVAGADAGVDGADDDALAVDVGGQAELGRPVPEASAPSHCGPASVWSCRTSSGATDDDGRVGGDGPGLVGGEDGGDAVDGELVGERHLDVAAGGALEPLDELGLHRLEVGAVLPHRRALRIELLARLGFRRGQPGLAAAVARDRGIGEADEVGGGLRRELGGRGPDRTPARRW